MAAVDFFTGFDYKWAQDGSVFSWDEAQYKQGWATIGSVPPSVEQFNRAQQVLDEKSNYLYAHIKQTATDAGLVMASGSTDTLSKAIRALSLPIYATTPSSNVGPIVYVIDRQQILLWQTIGTFTGYASSEVGKFTWGTSISPRPFEENLIGQTIDRSLAKYAALIAWADANGHMVASGSWTKGAFHFSTLTGNNVRLPDLRDMFIRATGTDADTANARGLGSVQAPYAGYNSISSNSLPKGPDSGVGILDWIGINGVNFNDGLNTNVSVPVFPGDTRPQNTALTPIICL